MLCNISREYLNKIENNIKVASDDVMMKISLILHRYLKYKPLDIIIDYLRVRFPTCDIKYIVHKVLGLKIQYLIKQDKALYSYDEQYTLGNISIMVSKDKDKGCLLELKGQGCREMEYILQASNKTWISFLQDILYHQGIIKRLDIAVNDNIGIVDIKELVNRCDTGKCISTFRQYQVCKSGKLVHSKDNIGSDNAESTNTGQSLYIGSKRSELYFWTSRPWRSI